MKPTQVISHRSRGFSLVELLVALVFISLLMAGMAKVFAGSVSVFKTTGETLSTQRNNSWALELINDEISQAGYVFPERILPTYMTSGTELMFRINPGVAVTGVTRVSDTNAAATEAEALTADEFFFYSDITLPIRATWGEDTLGEEEGGTAGGLTSAKIKFDQGGVSDLRAGDVMMVLDGGEKGTWETCVISGSPVANPVVFETTAANLLKFTQPVMQNKPIYAHKQGAQVDFVRPAQLVRLSLRAVALDPNNDAVRQPCLVRQQTDFPASGTVDWSTVPAQVIAENVWGFRVDVSFNGGANWARTNAANWDAIATNANTQLAGLTANTIPGFNTITNATRRDWFRNIPCLIRVDLSTRSAMRREEYNATTGARNYRVRTQTLMISPRNFGVGQ